MNRQNPQSLVQLNAHILNGGNEVMPCYWHTARYRIVQGFSHHPPTGEQKQLSAASYSCAALTSHSGVWYYQNIVWQYCAGTTTVCRGGLGCFFFPGIVARGQFPYHQNWHRCTHICFKL